jgi:hypothetical protein
MAASVPAARLRQTAGWIGAQDVHHESSVMLIEITCRLCGQAYTLTAEDFRRGPELYQRCPACRPTEARDPEVAETWQ